MDVKSNLRRAQSLRSVSDDHSLSWMEAGLREKRKSVSQLVAQYQNSQSGKATKADPVENKQKLTLQIAPIPVTESLTKLDTLVQNNETKESPKLRSSFGGHSNLTRSKSMEILPRQKSISTSALRELYESKVAKQTKSIQQPISSPQPKSIQEPKSAQQPNKVNQLHNNLLKEDAGINHKATEEPKVQTESKGTKKLPPKEENPISKVEKTQRPERRKTITGVYTEKISSQDDDKRKSVADFRDGFTLYGQDKSPVSVKAISALYLSKVAAAEPTGSLLKPEQDPVSPTKTRVSRMAEVAQKDSEQHENMLSNDDSTQLDLAYPVSPPCSRAESLSPIPPPPSKEVISTMYQQRQKCELRRLLKHTCPELKGLANVVDEELADILNSSLAAETAYGGEVQSRRWIFENGAVNNEESLDTQTHCMDKSVQGGHVFEQAASTLPEEGSVHRAVQSLFASVETSKDQKSHTECDPTQLKESGPLDQEEDFRVDVKATRKMFEGQSNDVNPEDVIPRKLVVSNEEKGAVQKQKRDFETCQTMSDSVKRTNPLDITHVTDVDQDCEAYLGISKAKEMFEKGSQEKESSSSANANVNTVEMDEILKANVRNRAQIFESTPLDRINWQNGSELANIEESMSKTLASLHNFSVIHSHGTLIEASEAAHVRKAKYNYTEDKGPEIEHEETIMMSMKSVLLQHLTRVNLNSRIAFLKEDDQGNVDIKSIDVPTYQLPFTVNQDKEYRTTVVVQVVEDLLGQETSVGKGVLIQEEQCAMGSIEILVYVLFRHDGHNYTGQTAQMFLGSGVTNKEEPPCQQLEVTPQTEKANEVPTQEENFKVDVKATRKMFEGQSMDTFKDNPEGVITGRVLSGDGNDTLINTKGDDTPNITYTPPPPVLDDDPTLFAIDENRTSNVKLFRSCIEKGELDYLKNLQKSQSEEDLTVTSEERDQNVIAPGNLKTIRALFANPDNAESSLQTDKPVQKEFKEPAKVLENGNETLPSPAEIESCIAEKENAEPDRLQHGQEDTKHMPSENSKDEGRVHQVELVHVAEDDELSNLQAAILSLQQATEEAKALQQSVWEKQKDIPPTMDQIISVDSNNQYPAEATEDHIKDIVESSQNPETEHEPEEKEEVTRGSVQAALESLGKSSFNVSKGDFKTAMIYRNAGKTCTVQKKITHVETAVKQSTDMIYNSVDQACISSPMSGQVTPDAQHEGAETGPCQGQTTNRTQMACLPPNNQTHPQGSLQASKKSHGPKPAIPPKPDHLKGNHGSDRLGIHGCTTTNTSSVVKQHVEQNHVQIKTVKQQSESHIITNHHQSPEGNYVAPEEAPEKEQLEESQMNSPANEATQGFQTSLQNFGGKTGRTTAPVKPKRIKMATSSPAENSTANALSGDSANDCNAINCKASVDEHEDQPERKVIMREKKVRKESEQERRQRLSVHMDEIMRDNASAALEIFDQLRKQEELKTILSKVEEIEEDKSQEHASDLQKIFDNVPDWAVPQKQLSPKSIVVEKNAVRSETVSEREMMSSMQVAYGDLEKASAAIITLKEQTLSRLMDIEETIKKALYSVSTLQNDSDIAGLSGLFKESMMDVSSSAISGNIRKISIGSSKTPKAPSGNNLDVPAKSIPGEPAKQAERSKPELSPPATKPRSGSPSSPSFISIQSAARKNTEPPAPQKPQRSPQKAETFQSTTSYNVTADCRVCCVGKGPCCSPANERRQVSTLQVQTIPEREKIVGTKTIRERYEETYSFGNKFYSSKTSTVMTTQPETSTCLRKQFMSSPDTAEVVTFPRINIASVKGNHAES